MRITKTYAWNRRDFCYDATCEHCGAEAKKISGYDDSHYYNNVVPDIKCEACKESSNSKPSDTVGLNPAPRYDENTIM